MSDIAEVLKRLNAGDQRASSDLLPLVYDELRRLAAGKMTQERTEHTLQATALVHEAYLRLVDTPRQQPWDSKAHFFGAAAEAMRRILIEHARRKNSAKRGGDFSRISLTNCGEIKAAPLTPDEVIELDDALQKLEEEDEVVAQLVRLRLYTGLSVAEAAKVMEISRTVAYEHWDYALAWFHAELK